jgi:predicted transcriptional regulator
MEGNEFRDEELSRLISDEYAGKILSATYKHPMSVQQVSRGCAIPIAVAYRRVAKMEEFGLVKCVGFEEVYRGKKVSYYECAVNMAKVTFAAGKFDVEIDFLPESELSHIGNSPILDESEDGEDA